MWSTSSTRRWWWSRAAAGSGAFLPPRPGMARGEVRPRRGGGELAPDEAESGAAAWTFFGRWETREFCLPRTFHLPAQRERRNFTPSPGGAILEKPAKEDFFSFFFFVCFFRSLLVWVWVSSCVSTDFHGRWGAGETHTYFSTAPRIGGKRMNS